MCWAWFLKRECKLASSEVLRFCVLSYGPSQHERDDLAA